MIIIPELETVVILVPRTGTRSLKNSILTTYPQSFLLYRHMEADGIPQGYDRWRRLGVVRNPRDRLWSLYKYLQDFGLTWCSEHDETYTKSMRDSVSVSFEDWLLTNNLPFTSPYDSAGLGRFYPTYTVRHPIPENKKSQFVYLRPDLGTEVWKYSNVNSLYNELGLENKRQENQTNTELAYLSQNGRDYIERWFRWDLENY